jgi:succinate dehydrogenase/fumarate reductase flavoprotein subunit
MATTAVASCDGAPAGSYVVQRSQVTPSQTVDVVVIGSGAAGSTAALSAKWAGAGDVVLLEKDPKTFGGTTAKSGGTFWVPNHPLLEDAGYGPDKKDPTLKFMAKLSYPEKYNASAPKLGLNDREYGWVEKYYDTGAEVCKQMQNHEAMPLAMAKFHDGSPMYDYNHDDENPVLQGRLLGCGMDDWMVKSLHGTNAVVKRMGWMRTAMPFMKEVLFLNEFGLDISYGIGLNFADRCKKALKKAGVPIEMGHSVSGLVMDGDKCVGVKVKTDKGEKIIEARKGVVFGSGGFSNSPELRAKYLKDRPIDGTGASWGNDGILVRIGEQLGLDLENMDAIWGSQCFLEESQETFETAACIFMFRGDSNFLVNHTGVRVMNEKSPYNTRVKKHYEPGNRLLFEIADQRAVDKYGCNFAKTLPGSPNNKLYIKGKTAEEFSKNLKERLAVVAKKSGIELELSADFEKNLKDTIERYNGFARTGKDLDFKRGESNSSQQWTFDHQGGKAPNKCMCPLDISKGGIYGIIIAPQNLDTKGGPALDLNSQCMKKGKPVPGLYAAGNASAASLSANAYWSGGATIGGAMVTGWLAGQHAAQR